MYADSTTCLVYTLCLFDCQAVTSWSYFKEVATCRLYAGINCFSGVNRLQPWLNTFFVPRNLLTETALSVLINGSWFNCASRTLKTHFVAQLLWLKVVFHLSFLLRAQVTKEENMMACKHNLTFINSSLFWVHDPNPDNVEHLRKNSILQLMAVLSEMLCAR